MFPSSFNPSLKTIVFGHHPCPDGIASIVYLSKKFGIESDRVSYFGLEHARESDMNGAIFSAMDGEAKNIIFADITPPISILKKILNDTEYTITLLDHHATAISAFNKNMTDLKSYMEMSPPRIAYEFDLKRSGAGIAYDYVFPNATKRPIAIELVQAIDLFTATSDLDIISEFCINSIKSEADARLEPIRGKIENQQIKKNIAFYMLACVFDVKIQAFFKESAGKMDCSLIQKISDYFDKIEGEGLMSLLDSVIMEHGVSKSVESILLRQINYQKNAIDRAVIIPSRIDDTLDVLLIEANIKSGRTFDALIAQRLSACSRRTIAMIANTEQISDNSNWISLRASDDSYNLYEIASQFKEKALAQNAGGHARASALQCSRAQIVELQRLASVSVSADFRFKVLTSLMVLGGSAMLMGRVLMKKPALTRFGLGLASITALSLVLSSGLGFFAKHEGEKKDESIIPSAKNASSLPSAS